MDVGSSMIAKKVANRVVSTFNHLIVESAFVIQVTLNKYEIIKLYFRKKDNNNGVVLINSGKHTGGITRTCARDMSYEPY